jgi:hypothetical protein
MSFASELTAMIDSGAGIVVGTVSEDGEPRADRGWAAAVVDEHGRRVRFVMSADDPAVVRNLETGLVSLTGAEVVTYQSIQLKGRPVVVEAPTADDIEMARVQTAAFFDAVHRTDGNPIEALWRMLPLQMIAVEMIVEETFDQTPGPSAGAAIDGTTR